MDKAIVGANAPEWTAQLKSKAQPVPSIGQMRRDYRRLMQDVNPLETFELRRTGMLDAHIDMVVTELNRVWRGGIPGSATFAEARGIFWRQMVASLPKAPLSPPPLTRCPTLCLDADPHDVLCDVRQLRESVRGDLREIRGRVSALRKRRG